MIRIKGGPVANNFYIAQINDDGSETKIEGVQSLEIAPIVAGELVTAKFTVVGVQLDLEADEIEG